jgi:hypothetical protein
LCISVSAVLSLLSGCSGGDAEGGGEAGTRGQGGSGGTQQPGASFDRSSISFVDNLLVKVDEGDWTLEEGLVATLEAMAGERDAARILRHPELLNNEGTGIVAMAYDYLEAGPDAEAKAAISGLLDLLVFSTEQLEAMAGLAAVPALPPGQLAPVAPKAAVEDCEKFFSGYGDTIGVGSCLEVRSVPGLGGNFRVFHPAPLWPPAGWTERHYDMAVQTFKDTIPVFRGLGNVKVPDMSIVFSAKANPPFSAEAAPNFHTKVRPCGVVLYTSMQSDPDSEVKQVIALPARGDVQPDGPGGL